MNSSLATLTLDSNPLVEKGNAGFVALIESLKSNSTIVSINLWRTGIDAASGNLLANFLEENDGILFCDVGHNMIDMVDQKRIADKLDYNLTAYEAREREKRRDIELASASQAKSDAEELVITF